MAELNPVLVKELRGRMRGGRSFVLLTIFLALLAGATLLFYGVIASQTGNDLNAGRQIGQALFLMIAFAALVGVSIITPSLTAGALAGERERQSFDLFWSGVMRSTLAANGLAIGSVALILLGIPFLALLASIASSFSSDLWAGSAVSATLTRLFLSFHPFIALGLTEAAIQNGEGAFFLRTELSDGSTIWLPQFWLMFTGLALLASALLLVLTTRQLQPERAEREGRGRRKRTAAE